MAKCQRCGKPLNYAICGSNVSCGCGTVDLHTRLRWDKERKERYSRYSSSSHKTRYSSPSRKTRYSSPPKKNKKGCFISTSTFESIGYNDNCVELETLRWFRDIWMSQNIPFNEYLIQKYYEISPLILEEINKSSDSKDIYFDIYNQYVKSSVEAIQKKKYLEAFKIYSNGLGNLSNKFLKKEQIEIDQTKFLIKSDINISSIKIYSFINNSSRNFKDILAKISLKNAIESQNMINNIIVTGSMGNFGKSIALNCKESNITPIIFLPKNTDTNIIKEIVSLGGCTIVSDFNNIEDINKDAQLFALKYNYYFVNQLDDDIEVYYQKMFADKILDELNSIDYIVTYIGTGTLAKSLISLAKGSQVQVVGVIEKGRELKPTIKKMDLQIHELEFDRVIDCLLYTSDAADDW
mgnify:FL=1